MKKICVAIRVFSRIEDLKCLIEIINSTWNSNLYDLYIVTNGTSSGYQVPKDVNNKVAEIIELENNEGHQSGSSQLLLAFWDNVQISEYEYTIIIEADTWIYGDFIINKYINKLEAYPNAVYAAAKWYDKYYSLATDFAIIKNEFLKNNRALFSFNDKAECHIANYLLDKNKGYIYVNENMLPNLPSYIKKYPFSDGGRLNCFPLSRMVTHHIEHLKDGIKEKKRLFNVVAGENFFDVPTSIFRKNTDKLLIWIFYDLTKLMVRKTWYSKTIQLF